MLSFLRREELISDLIAGHWYGCPGCGRNVCDDCGKASGRRCRACEATLEPDESFPTHLAALEDWRQYLPTEQDRRIGMGLLTGRELIACATEASIPEIDAALEDSDREQFRAEVLGYDLSRRLGCTDYFIHLGSPAREVLWTPEWERRLSVAARYYRERCSPAAQEALAHRELLRGWRMLAPASQSELRAVLEATLHPDPGVAWEALDLLDALRELNTLPSSFPEVLAWSIPVLRCGEPERVGAALTALRAVRGWHWLQLDEPLHLLVVQRLCEALVRRSEAEVEALVRRILFTVEPRLRNVNLVASSALGLTAELVPRLSQAITSLSSYEKKIARKFIAALSEADVAACAPPPVTLGMLEKEGLTPEERLEHIQLLAAMEPTQRSTLLPGLPAPAELLFALLKETDGACASSLDEDWVPPIKELLGSPHSRAWLMSFAAREPAHGLTGLIFLAAGPECEGLLVLLRQRLAHRNAFPLNRELWVKTLGRISSGPHSPACALVLAVFLDARERVSTRIVAARTLWGMGVRALPGAELAPALRDRSATLRTWALVMAGELPKKFLLPLREETNSLVRWGLSRSE